MRPRSTLVIGAGALIALAGAALLLQPWLEAYRWQSSPMAAQAERNAAAPTIVALRATPTPFVRPTPLAAAPRPTAAATRPAPAPTTPTLSDPTVAPTDRPVAPPTESPRVVPSPTLGPSDLKLAGSAFEFLDPPKPGATARFTLSIHNPTDVQSGPVSLDLPLAWFDGYRLEGVVPLPVDGTLNGEHVGNAFRLTVDGPGPRDTADVSVYVVTTDEVIDAPNVRAFDAEGREIGRAHPPTEAPVAEPGPVYALDIPRLHLHTGVVPVEWEPPLFVVGQLRASAAVTHGNSVLVGHVRGAAGYNVFDRLDEVAVGDEVVANSRGTEYQFVVTDTEVLPADDTSPTEPTVTPRLTLMTCTGTFNPLTGSYSDRLWVIAEPAESVSPANAPTL